MIYVDEMTTCLRSRKWPYSQACHLVADTRKELHVFAQSIGLKRSWFQNKSIPHYDLTANKRRLAIRFGAIKIDMKEFVEIMKKHRLRKLANGTNS